MQEVTQALTELRDAIHGLRDGQDELRKGQDELRHEMKRGQDELRQDMKRGQDELRHEIRDQSAILGGMIESVRDDVRMIADGHLALNDKFDTLEGRVDVLTEDVALLKVAEARRQRASKRRRRKP
jgi:hypothetical protein